MERALVTINAHFLTGPVMTSLLSHRNMHALFFLGCSALVLIAIYVEPFKSLDPCPMCMMQRALFVVIAGVALVAALHNPGGWSKKLYAALTGLTALAGAGVAIRQLWLQSLPEDRVPACGPGLDFMLEVFPLLEVLEMALRGTGDCAKVQWSLFGITIPGWSLAAFAGIALLSAYLLFSKRDTKAV